MQENISFVPRGSQYLRYFPNVPCQRLDWLAEEIQGKSSSPEAFGRTEGSEKLPVELQDMTYKQVDFFPFQIEEVKELRPGLMETKKGFVLEQGKAIQAVEFSFCEH